MLNANGEIEQRAEAESKSGDAPPSPTPQAVGPNPGAARPVARAPAILVTLIVAAIVGLSLWYLVQPQPIVIQGEADATRIDIAARVDGRVGRRPVSRGDDVVAGQTLFEIENPELITKLGEAEAALTVQSANLAHIEAGTRAEDIAERTVSLTKRAVK